ncbi:MAG: zeta toxin family protein [Alphaproteobacteria bacterium]|nr:zeta toxin family protein [Alphaproteobacteria bacterium]
MTFPIETPNEREIDPEILSVVEAVRRKAAAKDAPVLIHTAGVPGAGKSSFARALARRLDPITLLAFDAIMEAIPSYRTMANKEEAFARYELPARAAGYWLVRELIAKKADILFDHSASFPKHVDLLRFAKGAGYSIVFVYVRTPSKIAKERILARQRKEGRHTPLSYVDERLTIIEALLDRYKRLADVYAVIDNDTHRDDLSFFANEAQKLAEKFQKARCESC